MSAISLPNWWKTIALRVLLIAIILASCSILTLKANAISGIKITKVTTNGDTTTVFHFIVSDEWTGEFDLFGGGDKSIYYGPGRYVIIEEVPPGWVLDVTCAVLGDDITFEYLPGQGVIIILYTVDAGTVECTFTNCPVSPPASLPVGGIVETVNKVALVAPWLAVIGLVACISTVVFVAKKRR